MDCHLPAASLRGGVGQQDLAPKELEVMQRNTVLENVFRINIHQHRVSYRLLS